MVEIVGAQCEGEVSFKETEGSVREESGFNYMWRGQVVARRACVMRLMMLRNSRPCLEPCFFAKLPCKSACRTQIIPPFGQGPIRGKKTWSTRSQAILAGCICYMFHRCSITQKMVVLKQTSNYCSGSECNRESQDSSSVFPPTTQGGYRGERGPGRGGRVREKSRVRCHLHFDVRGTLDGKLCTYVPYITAA